MVTELYAAVKAISIPEEKNKMMQQFNLRRGAAVSEKTGRASEKMDYPRCFRGRFGSKRKVKAAAAAAVLEKVHSDFSNSAIKA